MLNIEKYLLLLPAIICSFGLPAQVNLEDYSGSWTGSFASPEIFRITVDLQRKSDSTAVLQLAGSNWTLRKKVEVVGNRIESVLAENTFLRGYFSRDGSFSGFIQSGILQYHILLSSESGNSLQGIWRPLMIDSLEHSRLYLSVEHTAGEQYEAYPFFGDQRFTGTWCGNFQKLGNRLTFSDMKTGMQFVAQLAGDTIQLEIRLAGKSLTTLSLVRTEDPWQLGKDTSTPLERWTQPLELADGWPVVHHSELFDPGQLSRLNDSIASGVLTFPHAILIAQKGKLLFEAYFQGYNIDTPHDQRSASKSITSAITGIIIKEQLIQSEQQELYPFLPQDLQSTLEGDPRKARITLQHLLTMSSGLDAIDFGSKVPSAAAEDTYQQSRNWLKTVVEAPMLYEPGTVANYGTANPFLLGAVLHAVVPEPLSLYMDQQLLAPLGIHHYIIQNDISGRAYMGGGMYLRPRDMLKFGQLYLDRGEWETQQILPDHWVDRSFTKFLPLENTVRKNDYGYLWWQETYRHRDREIRSFEARGAGGQYIMVLPELELVVVMTSGNYRNGRFQQPEIILEEYLLPALASF